MSDVSTITHIHQQKRKVEHQETARIMTELKEKLQEAITSNYGIVGLIELALIKCGWLMSSYSPKVTDGTALVDYGKSRIISNISDQDQYSQFLLRIVDILSRKMPVAPAQYRYSWTIAETFVDPVSWTLQYSTCLRVDLLSTTDELKYNLTEG